MKKICSILSLALVVFSLASCAPKHDKTIADLKAAINGESTASAKYADFAAQAAKEHLFNVEALFKATSQAEAIHANNHQAALATLGVTDFAPVVEQYEVKSTAENLQAAIDGEAYEFNEMYPAFIKDAEAEKVQAALVSFNYAQDTEKGHAKIYADALSKLNVPQEIADIYYVCPKCGNTFAGTAPELCDLCQTASSQFIVSKAVVVADPEQNDAVPTKI